MWNLIAIGWVVALAAAAQTAPVREMNILIGRGELVQFDRDLQRVVVAEPKIADAIVVSPREVMVNAKGVGKTTLIVWENGTIPTRFNVNVQPDTTVTDALLRDLQGKLPGITVAGNGEKLVLTGLVKTSEESKRMEGVASAFSKQVTNLLQLPPPAEPKQILLQVRFASVDRSALSELGFNYISRNGTSLGSLTTQQFQAPRFAQLQANATSESINFADLLNLFIFRPDLNIGATIRALQAKNLLQVLAEPNLIAMEGKEASFLAGGEFPFPTLTATTTGGAVAPVITVQFKKFGIQLGFTPTITSDQKIHLKVSPEVSSLDFSNAVTLQGFLIPAISVRRADTEVLLKDGESFAIAGMIDNRVTNVVEKLPGLGDIPIIGTLFKSRSMKKTQDELLVVITPRFVKPLAPGETPKMPANLETFLPTTREMKEQIDAKRNKKKEKKAEFSGPSGQVNP
jgi:pilus assembly protein CpaC